MSRASAIYEGTVRHRRYRDVEHRFTYPLFLMYLDLAELPRLFAGRWLWSVERPAPAWLRRRDFLPEEAAPMLEEAVRDRVERDTGRRPAGPVRLLAHPRYWGYSFNPVSFYYCFEAGGEEIEAVLMEVTNTPWGERHAYVLSRPRAVARSGARLFRGRKSFHVSPFLPMEMEYAWRLTPPGRRLLVHMENFEGGRRVFDATLALTRREITGPALARALALHPFMTARVMAWIHFQALRLWLKGAPFFAHPSKREEVTG